MKEAQAVKDLAVGDRQSWIGSEFVHDATKNHSIVAKKRILEKGPKTHFFPGIFNIIDTKI